MTEGEIERVVAAQIGALMGIAAIAGAHVRYVKPHGALGNLAADNRGVADAIARAIRAISPNLAVLAISGTELEPASEAAHLQFYSEVFADRAYLNTGRLVPRSLPGAMIEDDGAAADRIITFLQSGHMPTLDGVSIPLRAHSICVHGDGPHAVMMARTVRTRLTNDGVEVGSFLGDM